MLRVPGSINSKNSAEVKIIQEWNGQRPNIKPLMFRELKSDQLHHRRRYLDRCGSTIPSDIKYFNTLLLGRKEITTKLGRTNIPNHSRHVFLAGILVVFITVHPLIVNLKKDLYFIVSVVL